MIGGRHEECKSGICCGISPLRGTGRCASSGSSGAMMKDWLGINYCKKECVGCLFGKQNSCFIRPDGTKEIYDDAEERKKNGKNDGEPCCLNNQCKSGACSQHICQPLYKYGDFCDNTAHDIFQIMGANIAREFETAQCENEFKGESTNEIEDRRKNNVQVTGNCKFSIDTSKEHAFFKQDRSIRSLQGLGLRKKR